MRDRPPRPRLIIAKDLQPAVIDPDRFVKNKSSNNAKVIKTVKEGITVELWFDKHYFDRYQFGDDNGAREGIDKDVIEELVLSSIKHLLFYGATIKSFSFLNHEQDNSFKAIRVVIQRMSDVGMLNCVIEVHYKSLREYEITVKTAMCNDNFKMSDGQFSIEVINEDNSVLKVLKMNAISEIYRI